MTQRHLFLLTALLVLSPARSLAQGYGCLEPVEPYAYDLSKSDPLYETARDEFQIYLEDLERYLRCLEHERAFAYQRLSKGLKTFQELYGKDAVFRSRIQTPKREGQ